MQCVKKVDTEYIRLSVEEAFKYIRVGARTDDRKIVPLSVRNCKTVSLKEGKYKPKYKILHCSFDIETSSINEHSYMYIWQFGFIADNRQYVIKGRTWDEFTYLMKNLSNKLRSHRTIVWVHNLGGYEFQFMRGRYHEDISGVFAKENDNPIKFLLYGNIEFRDSMSLCPKSLAKLAEDYCHTQKLKGDLDYSILRNSKSVLDEASECYCDNDAIILSEYSQYVHDNLIINNKIPLTQTGILRERIILRMKIEGIYDNVMYEIKRKFPSQQLYHLMMNYLFKGGYSNGNYQYNGDLLYDVESFDFTSSYPAIMLQEGYYFPDQFIRTEETDFNVLFNDIARTKCVAAVLEFEELEATTAHNYISIHKVMDVDMPLVLNGKVRTAQKIKVFETEIDIAIYRKMYKWKSVKVIAAYVADKKPFPEYMRCEILNAYVLKSTLKKAGKIYSVEKATVNAGYGLTCQRLIECEWSYDSDADTFEQSPARTYSKQIKGRFILPQVGIYVTAWARYNLIMSGILNYKDSVYLYDTDSLKGHFEDRSHLNKYNDMCIARNKNLAEKYDIDFSIVEDLGCWDEETSDKNGGKYQIFKQLGAKRYLYLQNDGIHQTVAGLGKNAIYNTVEAEYFKEYKLSKNDLNDSQQKEIYMRCFDKFRNNMYITDAEKMQHTRFEYVTDVIDGEVMEEYSGVYLHEAEFTLTMNRMFVDYILNYKRENMKFERRR